MAMAGRLGSFLFIALCAIAVSGQVSQKDHTWPGQTPTPPPPTTPMPALPTLPSASTTQPVPSQRPTGPVRPHPIAPGVSDPVTTTGLIPPFLQGRTHVRIPADGRRSVHRASGHAGCQWLDSGAATAGRWRRGSHRRVLQSAKHRRDPRDAVTGNLTRARPPAAGRCVPLASPWVARATPPPARRASSASSSRGYPGPSHRRRRRN